MMGIKRLQDVLKKPISIAPLIFFRGAFAILMIFSLIRFAAKGWIYELYVKPTFYFSYFGFDWLPSMDKYWVISVFAACLISVFGILLGYFYRISTFIFLISFSLLELIDKANYLNHYYFITLITVVLLIIPANRAMSFDVRFRKLKETGLVPKWTILILMISIGGLYFMAGIAKLNYDWLVEALPMKMWLPPHSGLPLIGPLMDELWVAYFFSWMGALYDLTIPFLLYYKRTRKYAYISVIFFHGMTAILFPIGMFPYVMICCSLIFLSASELEKILTFNHSFDLVSSERRQQAYRFTNQQLLLVRPVIGVLLFFIFLFPLRFLAYPGNCHWHEQGYRFSWRVMLMEKAGQTFFYVKDPKQKGRVEIDNTTYLLPHQEKQMSTQPDMILQFAHYLAEQYKDKGIEDPIINVESWVTLNGAGSRLLINPFVDLTTIEDGWRNKEWILPYDSIITVQEYSVLKKNRNL